MGSRPILTSCCPRWMGIGITFSPVLSKLMSLTAELGSLADMVVRGEVKLDEPVRDLLPAGTLADGQNRPITLRDLASHYSGLPRLPANLAPTDPADPYAGYDEARLHAFLKGWTAEVFIHAGQDAYFGPRLLDIDPGLPQVLIAGLSGSTLASSTRGA